MKNTYGAQIPADMPTPEEIAERAAIEKANHMARKLKQKGPPYWPYAPQEMHASNLAEEEDE